MSGTSGRWFVAYLVGSFCNLYIVNTPKEQNAGVSMVQKRRQPAWKTENQRKRSKKIARKRRRVIARDVQACGGNTERRVSGGAWEDGRNMRKFLIEATFAQAKHDGIAA